MLLTWYVTSSCCLVQVADPEDACSSIVNAPSVDWIALIVRSRHETGEAPDDCTFDMKVRFCMTGRLQWGLRSHEQKECRFA